MTTQHNNSRIKTEAVMEAGEVMTLEQLLAFCIQLQPVEAAKRGDSDLCVTPLVTQLLIDGRLVDLTLKNGCWAAGYPRVSGEVQRAAGSAAGKTARKSRRRKSTQQVVQMNQNPGNQNPGNQNPGNFENINEPFFNEPISSRKGAADGYSEEEQLTRQIRHFVREGWAFRIYSDCGLTGEYPSNDPRLIKRLLEGKAARYRKIYERTLLDETSLLRRTPAQITSMRAYLEKRVAQIRAGSITDNEFAFSEDALVSKDASVSKDVPAPNRPVGQPRRRVYFRQAFTQLWKDIEAGKVHTVAVSDRSRLCRAADLESEFLLLLSRHQTRLVGLIEDLSTLDVSDPLRRGFSYMIASVNEYRLEEVCGHSFRGLLQLLESGHPHGRVAWWMLRDVDGKAVEMPAYAAHARRVVELYLSGLGVGAIITKLHNEGVRVGGEPLTSRLVRYVLESDAVSGLHWQFGLAWDIYPPLLTPEVIAELREHQKVRRDRLVPNPKLLTQSPKLPTSSSDTCRPGRAWANHVFTGLLRCGTCGYLLRYLHPGRTQKLAGGVNYYRCPASHKSRPGEPPHAYINESKLTAFLEELLGENPQLITNALSAGGDRAARGAARRALLEERLQQARRAYTDQEEQAQAKAVQAALAAGIREEASSFSSVVAEIRRGLLETEQGALVSLEEELARLGAQAGQDKQTERVLAAVGQLKGGLRGGVDVLTRNNLLKSIFAEITMYPFRSKSAEAGQRTEAEQKAGAGGSTDTEPHGCLIMRLAGVDTPLPPVRLRRLTGKDMRLPSVREWIADIYSPTPVEEGRTAPTARARRGFYYVLRRLVNGTAENNLVNGTVENSGEEDGGTKASLQRLMACIQADKDFPKCSKGKKAIMAHLARTDIYGTDIYDAMREQFEAAWSIYLDAEHRRLSPPPVVSD